MPDNAQPPSRAQIIHEIIWSEAFPWWILLKAAGMAFTPTVLILATLATAGTWAGFSLLDSLGLPSGISTNAPIADLDQTTISLPTPSHGVLPTLSSQVDRLPTPVRDLLLLLSKPWNPLATSRQFVGSLFRCIWFLLVWSIFATAITRYVALRLVDEEQPSFRDALRFGTQKWPATFNSAAFVFFGIVALAIPGALLGLVMRFDWGLAVVGVLWPLILLGAVVLAILGIGLAAGWPLMVAAVGVERGDSFQAISTAFSYLYQRPIHFAFYGFISCVLAVLGFFAAGLFADTTVLFALWAGSFGMGHDRTADVIGAMAKRGADPRWGIQALQFWTNSLRVLLGSFGWGFFWSIAPAIYLLLRQSVDATELDEIVLDEPVGA
ncbi:MAG TPA: hypothetical protein DD662_09150 [Planctomycetaceae bacterium]|jgi:hypothetical protein|nr:hypothetical protein [Planctomycetaceae bacterium]